MPPKSDLPEGTHHIVFEDSLYNWCKHFYDHHGPRTLSAVLHWETTNILKSIRIKNESSFNHRSHLIRKTKICVEFICWRLHYIFFRFITLPFNQDAECEQHGEGRIQTDDCAYCMAGSMWLIFNTLVATQGLIWLRNVASGVWEWNLYP